MSSQFASQLSSSNLNNFLNNFSNGGFVTFGQTLTPSNNFYGGLAFTAQNTGQATQQSQNVFSVKTTASQGYRNSQVCPDGSSPSGFHCQRPNGSVYNVTTASCNDGGTGSDILIPNDGQCANGQEPTVTMPGIINTQSMDQALGGHTKLIAAANDIVGIVQAAASSLLTGIVNAGINAVTQSVNGALQRRWRRNEHQHQHACSSAVNINLIIGSLVHPGKLHYACAGQSNIVYRIRGNV